MWVPITNTRARTQRKCTKPPQKNYQNTPTKIAKPELQQQQQQQLIPFNALPKQQQLEQVLQNYLQR